MPDEMLPGSVPLGLKCAEDGAPAVGICGICDRPACASCVVRQDGHAVTCRGCGYGAAVTGGVKHQGQIAAGASARAAAKARWRPVAAAVGLTCASFALVVWVVPPLVDALVAPEPFAFGAAETADAPGLEAAIGGLWRVRAAMDAFALSHAGRAPASVADLTGAPPACPGCGDGWIFTTSPGAWQVACPHPRRHARSAILLDSHYGPPQVRADEPGGEK